MKTKTRILSLVLCLAMVIGYFTFGVSAEGETATLVEDASDLKAGDEVVIVKADGTYAMGAQSGNNCPAVAITTFNNTNNSFTVPDGAQVLTLVTGKSAGSWAFSPSNGNYLYAAGGSSKNHLKTTTTLNDNASFTITIDGGIATIKSVGNTSRGWMRFNPNSGSPIFSCYGSGQYDIAIYKINTTVDPSDPCTHANVTVDYDETNHWDVCSDCNEKVEGTTEAHELDANGDCTGCDHHEDPSEPEEPAISGLTVGDKIVFAYTNGNGESFAMGAQDGNIRSKVDTTITDGVVEMVDGIVVFTVEEGSKTGTYAFKNPDGNYLAYKSGATGNNIYNSDTKDDYASWTVEVDAEGKAVITNVGNTERQLQYNPSSPRFVCYKGTMQNVTIYKISDVTFTTEGHNVRLQDLIKIGYYFKATAAEGVTFDKVGALLWTAEDYAKENNSALAQDLTVTEKNGVYTVETDGIYAQNLDTVYVAVPYVVINGEYVYGDMDDYSVLEYAKFIYEYTGTEQDYLDAKSVIVDLLNYANAARNYFVLTEGLTAPETALNSILADADKALDWNDSLKQAYPTADETGAFDAGYDGRNINLLEAIQIGAYYKNTDVAGGYFWTESAYDATQTHDATTKTGTAVLKDYTTYKKASVTGIYAYNLYDTYYLRVYNSANELSDTTALSVASYLTWVIENADEDTVEKTQALTELAKAMLIYGSNAKDNPAINK